MTITYDAEGKCTRCGSDGFTPERVYDVTGEATDIRSLVPCPCHGWRPVSCAPEMVEVMVGKQFPGSTNPSNWDMVLAWLDSGKWFSDGDPMEPSPTHWHPKPQPPEGV